MNIKEALVGICLGVCIILIIGTGIHLIQNASYLTCMTKSTTNFLNNTISLTCNKPGWWFGL